MALDFLNSIGEKAREAAAYAGEKAKAAAEVAKVNVQIATEQRNIDKNYRAVGEWFVAEYQGEIPAEVKDLVEAINASKARIAEMQASLSETEEAPAEEPAPRFCPNCGSEVTGGKFCSNCGAPVEE